jgi:bifunctional DNA-binding transcriptional regulator/antitoxin component of YhaV-PrlF toxin-antitoxin module
MHYLLVMVKTHISCKGQTTIPSALRKKWKASQVWWEMNPDGSARVSPTPDIMSLLGSASQGKPRDPGEKKKARLALGRNAAREGLSK